MNFNYSESNKVPSILFDLDGTITNFEELDNKIIREEIFKDCPIVVAIDKIAWKVNRLDLIKNTTIMLKLRLFVYSLIAGISYKKVFDEYSKGYVEYSRKEILKHKKLIKALKEKGYHIIVLSNNKMADNLFLEEAEISSVNSKFREIRKIKEYCYIKYFVGNNLMDDIVPAFLYNVKSVYVGKSKAAIWISKFLNAKNIRSLECLKKIKKSG